MAMHTLTRCEKAQMATTDTAFTIGLSNYLVVTTAATDLVLYTQSSAVSVGACPAGTVIPVQCWKITFSLGSILVLKVLD